MKYACIAMALGVLGFATPVVGQEVIVPAPAVTYYSPAPVTGVLRAGSRGDVLLAVRRGLCSAYAPVYGYYPAPYYAPRWPTVAPRVGAGKTACLANHPWPRAARIAAARGPGRNWDRLPAAQAALYLLPT